MKKNNKSLIYLMVVISIILCIPSIIYLINNRTVDSFEGYYTYTLIRINSENERLINGIIVIGLMLIFSIIYVLIIKKEKKCFKSTKHILIFIMVISLIFMLILPYLSSDIYYYIGDS